MLDIVSFTLLGAKYLLYPLNILELCFGTELSTWKLFNPAGPCFEDILGVVLILRLVFTITEAP